MGDLHQAKRPVSVIAGRYGHPLHPALVAVPIGAWVASLLFDVASHIGGEAGAFVRGSFWLIALGVAGALAAATVGFLDLLAIPPGTRAHRTALVHMGLNLTAVAAYVVGLLLRRSHLADTAGVPAGLVALSVLALLLVAGGGYLGGELAFRYGVRVADESTQAEGYVRTRPRDSDEIEHTA